MAKTKRKDTKRGQVPKGKGAKRPPGPPKAVGPRRVASKVGARAKAQQAAKARAPAVTPVVPKAVSPVEERKEHYMAEAKQLTPGEFLATVLVPQYSRESGHICWDCKHFKPVLKGSKFPPADTVGWCTMIHWPFYWCITDFNVVKECYAFQKGVYTTKKF